MSRRVGGAFLDRPEPAVEQALLAVVAQAHELVARRRHRAREPAALAHAAVVGAAGGVAADQHLVGVQHPLRIEIGPGHHLRLAVAAGLDLAALPHVHGQPHDRIVLRLPVNLGQHGVGLRLGEEAAALDRRKLRRVAQDQQRHAEGEQVAAEFGIDHRTFVDHDQPGLGGGRVVPQVEARGLLAGIPGLVDQAVDGGGALAALGAHHLRRLAGKGREQNLAVDALGDMTGEGGLAGAGIAEQPEHRGRAVAARAGP